MLRLRFRRTDVPWLCSGWVYHKYDLPFPRPTGSPVQNILDSPSQNFLVNFGGLPYDSDTRLRPHHTANLTKQFFYAERRFKNHCGTAFFRNPPKHDVPTSALDREKSVEREGIGWQSGGRHGKRESRYARHNHGIDSSLYSGFTFQVILLRSLTIPNSTT